MNIMRLPQACRPSTWHYPRLLFCREGSRVTNCTCRRYRYWAILLAFVAGASSAQAQIDTDTFDAPQLGTNWTLRDPNQNDAVSLTARPGWLQIQVGGPDEDIWLEQRGGAPLLSGPVMPSDADFAVETYVDLATSNGGYPALNAIGGLIVVDPSRESDGIPFLLTLGLQHNWAGGTEVILQKPGESLKWASPGANAAYLRLLRNAAAATWTVLFKVHARDPWTQLETVGDDALPPGGVPTNVELGLFAKTWDAKVGGGANIDFAYFSDTSHPLPVEIPAASEIATDSTSEAEVASLKTFCISGKERTVLNDYREAELLRYSGRGCLTHMWFGGDWPGYERTRIRIYVDGQQRASIDMQLGLGHGVGFGDDAAPWGSAKMGKTGHPSGLYNAFKIPFGNGIRVTAQRDKDAPDGAPFWWIVRGTENLPATIAGVRLPDRARLRLHKLENYLAKPYEEFSLCDVPGAGALYQVTMAADGQRDSGDWKDISYLEAIVRAYLDDGKRRLELSSGLEDYFLGTYYFNRGRYANGLAGLTHLDTKKNTFSGYRFHDDDPIFFQQGLRLTAAAAKRLAENNCTIPPTLASQPMSGCINGDRDQRCSDESGQTSWQ